MKGSREPEFMYISNLLTCLWKVEALNPSKFNSKSFNVREGSKTSNFGVWKGGGVYWGR